MKIQFLPLRKHTITPTKGNWLMLIIVAFREDTKKEKILSIKEGGIYNYHGALKASVITHLTPDKGLCHSLIHYKSSP
jgi:hypothetical protein